MNTSMTTSENKSEGQQNFSNVGQKSCNSQFAELTDENTVTNLNIELQNS